MIKYIKRIETPALEDAFNSIAIGYYMTAETFCDELDATPTTYYEIFDRNTLVKERHHLFFTRLVPKKIAISEDYYFSVEKEYEFSILPLLDRASDLAKVTLFIN